MDTGRLMYKKIVSKETDQFNRTVIKYTWEIVYKELNLGSQKEPNKEIFEFKYD